MPVSARLTRSIQKANHRASHFYLLFLFLRCNILPSNSQQIKVSKLNRLQQAFSQWAFKDAGKRWGWNRRGCVYWMVQKKKSGEKKSETTSQCADPWRTRFHHLTASLTCTRAGCLVVLGLPPPAFITSWLRWDLHPTTRSPPPSVPTPAFTTGLRTPTLLTERAWQPSTGAQPSAGTPSLKSGWWRKGRVKRIVAPTESKVNSVVYVGNLRMYLDTSVQVTCCTGCFLLHWTASCSSSPGTVNSLLETAACCL